MSSQPLCHSNFSQTVHLESTLPHQSSPRLVLEKELGCRSTTSIPSTATVTPKSAAELVNDIAALEVEVMHMERYLLSLYRTAFEHHLATLPSAVIGKGSRSHFHCKTESPLQDAMTQSCCHKDTDTWKGGTSQHNQTSPPHVSSGSDNQSYVTPPEVTSRRDPKNAGSSLRSLADHLGTSLIDHVPETPDRLAEDIVRCISAIYCKLGNPSLTHIGLSASPTSSLSSSSTFSPQDPFDNWSPWCNEEATLNCQLQVLKEKNEPYAAMIEVLKIHADDDKFNFAATMLQNFRSLVQRLEKVDPEKMKREEKLAFWINIHNALVMHAYLAYGIHGNRMRSTSLILKAAYNVGGHSIDAYAIQSSILGCQSHRSSQWLQTLFSPGKKFKEGSGRHIYALDYPEPLVHFALCSGTYSDPAVRVYTSKNVFQELKLAKEEFIQASVCIHKERKIFLPKILYYFAKDALLNLAGLLDVVHGCVTEAQQKAIQRCIKGRLDKYIEWSSHNTAFRYLIHKELAKERIAV
ncbi:hypothetical protein HHK36_008862 [Tetracentron sinense]|uniref:DUF547 domain-containing protein n=1 Tax=Tetracentron sinense TaxID=13715 RepID=A0A834ZJC8_TETSI|nr:hypothetical protein HHK36_008862 [Tetracentron sinense]